jgi:hypothetical protein
MVLSWETEIHLWGHRAGQRFLATDAGVAAQRTRTKYILIASEIMPSVASIDVNGIGE